MMEEQEKARTIKDMETVNSVKQLSITRVDPSGWG
jgi:hypothetical protein